MCRHSSKNCFFSCFDVLRVRDFSIKLEGPLFRAHTFAEANDSDSRIRIQDAH